ncbi:N-acyl-D-amino-acid deacylase family protein [Actinomadura rubrisoli]|uniref:D-aminoacylase n=1 Tax=Actinomadura rubrisoli TaxID=2530368 RepID=A0A4V2YZC1_9ACTN|nr:D-aminoacylase [Actinomadura rubrisoli]TDD96427.1 D-aminoacylase [Actinomadura rubrisoli]
MTDLLITGGLVADGTGSPLRRADIAVSDGRITGVGTVAGPAARVIDATDRVVCPGFIDLHSHSDLALLGNPAAHSKIRQGVTTEVVGNCGLGAAPLIADVDRAALRAAIAFIDVDPGLRWTWQGFADYLDVLARARPSVNVVTLVAHLPLRAGVVGFADRPATPAELSRMCGHLAEALDAGAAGLSTGLVYAPLCYAAEDELTALARVVAAHDRIFAWHVRDYGDDLLESVRQALRVARSSGCRVQISHLAAVGRRNWGKVAAALTMIDEARAGGARVTADVYPYLAGSANLSQLLPAWAHAGGGSAMTARLADPAVRQRIRREWADAFWSWDDIMVGSVPESGDREAAGRTIAELTAERGQSGDDVVMDLVAAYGNAVSMVAFGRSEDDLRTALRHPAVAIGSDGFALDPDGVGGEGVPHPRSYGCYPRLLARYAGSSELTLEDAVHKSSGLPAELYGLTDRGVLRPGAAADLVVLDPGTIGDRATFTDPHRFPAGIEVVMVNGALAVTGGTHTSARTGMVLRAHGQIGARP